MKFFIITFSFKDLDREANFLSKGLISFPKNIKCFPNTWIIGTEESPREIYSRIKPYFAANELFLIIEVKNSYYGWMNPKIWEWMAENLKL